MIEKEAPMLRPISVVSAGLLFALAACSNFDPLDDAAAEGGLAAMPGEGECGLAEFQGYVGQSIAALNTVDMPADARVMFPTTPATMDFNAARLNVAVDSSDTITRVYCG
jgi:hypothetical protein